MQSDSHRVKRSSYGFWGPGNSRSMSPAVALRSSICSGSGTDSVIKGYRAFTMPLKRGTSSVSTAASRHFRSASGIGALDAGVDDLAFGQGEIRTPRAS